MQTMYIWRQNAGLIRYTEKSFTNGKYEKLPSKPQEESGSIAFQKPKRPTVTSRASDGYRPPTAYAAGSPETCGYAEVSGNTEYRWSSSGRMQQRQGVEGSIVIRCADANPGNLLVKAGSANTINMLRTRIRNNIADEVLDVSMVLAEMQGTVNTATTMLNRIGRSMLAIKRRNPQSFYYLLNGRRRDGRRPTDKFLRTTAGEYLQWKYGVMPSVYDLQGALRGLDINEKGGLFDHPPLLTARASVRNTNQRSFTGGSGWLYPIKGLDFTVTTEVKARCDYSVKAEGLRGLNRYGIGLSTIPTILFDKTPFTFVLNMAIPISSLIKAWSALSGVDVRSYCETIYASSSAHGSTLTDGYIKVDYMFPEVSTFKRNVYSAPPMPLPYVQNPIKTGNLATVLALFTSLRK